MAKRAGPRGGLLERDDERRAVRRMLRAARSGRGGALLISGPAGIGKTAVLELAAASARRTGMLVLRSRADELERDFGLGVARQLLEPAIGGPIAPPADAFAALHELYWQLADLAARGAVLAIVDDGHAADLPSLRWLVFVANRIAAVPIALIVAARRADGESDELLAALARADGAVVIEPRPLGLGAAAELCGRLGAPTDDEFVAACVTATGGNPFLLTELLRDPATGSAAPAAARAPRTVARAIRARVRHAGRDATSVAEALAVLGPNARRATVARLAGVDGEPLELALARLRDAEVLDPELSAPQFVHPLVRTALLDAIGPSRRAEVHGRAAALLADDGGDPEEVAAHLLLTEPIGAGTTVGALRLAAAAALDRGNPGGAVTYLRRAIGEPPDVTQRPVVACELGEAAFKARDPDAPALLRAAQSAAPNLELRARATVALVVTHAFSHGWRWGADELDGIIAEAARAGDAALEARLTAVSLESGLVAVDLVERSRERLARARVLAEHEPAAGRALWLALAFDAAIGLERSAEVPALVARGLDGGRFVDDETGATTAAVFAAIALIFVDELDEARATSEAMLEDGRRRGLVLGVVAGGAHRGYVALREGRLREAEADLRVAFELAARHELNAVLGFASNYLTETLIARGTDADLDGLLAQVPITPDLHETAGHALLLDAIARRDLARGRSDEAAAGLLRRGAINERLGLLNPNASPWRSLAAIALAPRDPDQARELVDEELSRARATGLDRAIGVALRADGILRGERGVDALRGSVEALASAPLERARTLLALGGTHRVAGRVAEARDTLLAALDLADRCGAAALAARARSEAIATGARPRRARLKGIDALTPSERQAADLAAAGRSNREIAETLFLTVKTVEDHLGGAYRKLGITSRGELSTALAPLDEPPTSS